MPKSKKKVSEVVGDEVKRRVLNELVLSPRLKAAARKANAHPTSVFRWIKQSIDEPQSHTIEWMGRRAPFFQHVNAARKLNIVALDHAARDLALNGHASPKFHDGRPVWKISPQIAADSLELDELSWIEKYGTRRRDDHYERDED